MSSGRRPVSMPLLHAAQHLDHHQWRQSPQAHFTALSDRGLGQLPVPLVGIGIGGDRGAPSHVMARAVAMFGFGSAAARATWQGPSAGSGRSRGSVRNCSSETPALRRSRR